MLAETALDPAEFWQAHSLIRPVYIERRWVRLGETDFSFRLFLELRRVNLLTLKEALVAVVQLEQNTLQGVYGRILEETAVRVGIVAPHRQLLHHLVLAELLFLTSAVSGLLDRQGTIPNKSLAASILAHQVFLSICRLQPVARESLLYLH